jgi:hypothetical protein
MRNARPAAMLAAMSSLLAACGGSSSSSTPTFVIGGSVAGLLANTMVILQLNGGNATPVSVNSSFTFSTQVATGGKYNVTIASQPTGQLCAVQNATGVVGSANVSVAVTCTSTPYTVGGSLQGLLPGNAVTLALNGADNVVVSANGSFTFGQSLISQTAYAVSADSSAAIGQTCTLTNGSGAITAADITNVNVTCVANSYSVEVGVFGMFPHSSATVQLNGANSLVVTDGASFAFPSSLLTRSAYTLSIAAQPGGQTCFFQGNSSGTVTNAVVAVVLVCPWHVLYVGGAPNYIDPTSFALFGTMGVAANSNIPINPITPTEFAVLNPKLPFIYALNDTVFSEYAIDPVTGLLSVIDPVTGQPSSVTLNMTPGQEDPNQFITIDSSGKFLYTVSTQPPIGIHQLLQPDLIAVHEIDSSTGLLSGGPGMPTPPVIDGAPVIEDPNGHFLFTGAGTYSIDLSTGDLTKNATATPIPPLGASCSFAMDPVIDPMGRFLYSYALNDNGVFLLTSQAIDPTSGNLTAAPGSPYSVPNGCDLAVTPDGRFLYASGFGAISAFSVDQTSGALTPVPGSPFVYDPHQDGSAQIAIDPTQQFLYVFGTNMVPALLGYTIDATTGALTSFNATPSSLGDIPIGPNMEAGTILIFPLVQ